MRKMRLIDANKLLQETWEVETKDMFHMTEIVDVVSAIDIEKAPTVDAIPVEWIRKYTNHRTVEFGDMWVFINCMINDWDKENESDTNSR